MATQRSASLLVLLGLWLGAACSAQRLTSETDKSDVVDAQGSVDASAWDTLCKMRGATAGCDLCGELGWYGDGVCDTFCPSADPDCEAPQICGAIPQSQMTATATSAEPGYEADKAIDGTPETFWHTPYDMVNYAPTAPLPQSITLSLGATVSVTALHYTPPGQANPNGIITSYIVYASTDAVSFTQIAVGVWPEDATEKTVALTETPAAYVELQALSGHGGFAGAGEITIDGCVDVSP